VKRKFLSQRGIRRNCKTISGGATAGDFYILAAARLIIAY
jgi:hypothetical protein